MLALPDTAVGNSCAPVFAPSALDRHERRTFLQGLVACASYAAFPGPPVASAASGRAPAPGPVPTQQQQATAFFVYTGCRTTRERNARGDGINVYRMEPASGRWTHVQLCRDLVNPSFLALDRSRRFLYTVHGDGTEMSSFRIDERTGELSPINRRSTHGKNPVHLSFDPTNRFVVVANHISSSVAVLGVNPVDGAIGDLVDLVTLEGKIGPHRIEQPFAKPHQVAFDASGRFIVVPDKGLDGLFVFRFDGATGKLTAADTPFVSARETSGPRHFVYHPTRPYAYAINELDSTMTGYRYDGEKGRLTPFQIVSTLPDTCTGNSRASELAVSPDGRFVYGSNRGHDSLVVFTADRESGRLSPVEWIPSGGRTPRFFALDPTGAYLYAANEDSDTIVTFSRNEATGRLTPVGDVMQTGSPVCILFRPTR
ncbi:MAG TPA: lactonase family protein [Vicinamibacterales bacterium]|jgi:6-phosphogluconolactonase (cycloisomerase 2 family)